MISLWGEGWRKDVVPKPSILYYLTILSEHHLQVANYFLEKLKITPLSLKDAIYLNIRCNAFNH